MGCIDLVFTLARPLIPTKVTKSKGLEIVKSINYLRPICSERPQP
jgi:hypothetical protein